MQVFFFGVKICKKIQRARFEFFTQIFAICGLHRGLHRGARQELLRVGTVRKSVVQPPARKTSHELVGQIAIPTLGRGKGAVVKFRKPLHHAVVLAVWVFGMVSDVKVVVAFREDFLRAVAIVRLCCNSNNLGLFFVIENATTKSFAVGFEGVPAFSMTVDWFLVLLVLCSPDRTVSTELTLDNASSLEDAAVGWFDFEFVLTILATRTRSRPAALIPGVESIRKPLLHPRRVGERGRGLRRWRGCSVRSVLEFAGGYCH
mmetsp:Transcript_1381/g.3189  ORF Transcript_1381/g.3189 Transcript_1381/m.3189 type:complete len:260 (-) Transcript_1381:345-1124(-)